MHDFVCIVVYLKVCTYVCIFHRFVSLWYTWLRAGLFSWRDTKQQKKSRLSRKVNRRAKEISITDNGTFLWTPGVFIYIALEMKTVSVGKLAACLGPAWHFLCRLLEENVTKQWSLKTILVVAYFHYSFSGGICLKDIMCKMPFVWSLNALDLSWPPLSKQLTNYR